MSNSRFIKTKSNFTFKNRHQVTPDGTILERDYMTITGGPGNNTNFKFARNLDPVLKKKHKTAEAEVYNGEISKGEVIKTKSSEIKPDYESLQDFAYYGSAVELIRSSLNGIIARYPVTIIVDSENGEFLNEYNVDFFEKDVKLSEIKNRYRFFSVSFSSYKIAIDGNDFDPISSWESYVKRIEYDDSGIENPNCEDRKVIKYAILNNAAVIEKKFDFKESEEWMYSMYHLKSLKKTKSGDISFKLGDPIKSARIQLNDDVFAKEYNSLDEFQKILVNKETDPKFTSFFYKTVNSDDSSYKYKESYTWPTLDGVNPSITCGAYKRYIDRLTELAEESDMMDSDNIWRSMTHESIKGLDWTFVKEKDDNLSDVIIDNTRVAPVLRVWGRVFDDLKRYIDTIGYTNAVTYDEKHNTTNRNLIDSLNLSGWDLKQVYPTNDRSIRIENLFSGDKTGKDFEDVNLEVLKRLKINSPYILRQKGTVNGIKSLLSVLGFTTGDYSIKEGISVAFSSNGNVYPSYEDVKKYNMLKNSYNLSDKNKLQGLPLKSVSLFGEDGGVSYVIPWFNQKEKYDRDPYFQMKGGWGYITDKEVVNPLFPDHKTILKSDSRLNIYDETYPILKIVNDTDGLVNSIKSQISAGDIVYVTDISKMLNEYQLPEGEKLDIDNCSNYFVLKRYDLSYTLGYSKKYDSYGWKNIPNDAFDPAEWEKETHRPGFEEDLQDVKKVMYLESLREDMCGNNPHKGNAKYDGGNSYLNYFHKFFYDDDFTALSIDEINEMHSKKIGFVTNGIVEKDEKCMFFRDRLKETKDWKDTFDPAFSKEPSNRYNGLFNPEGGKLDDEAAANSIINLKNITIRFFIPSLNFKDEQEKAKFEKDFKDYVLNVVMYYVKQMIPSTSILKCVFGDKDIRPKAEIMDVYKNIRNNVIIDII